MSPRIRRTFDPADINPIVNHESVFPLIALPGQINADFTDFLADPRNVALITEGGAILFCPDPDWGSGIYEVHTNFIDGFRGYYAIVAMLEAYRWMFTRTECLELQTKVPAFNRAADLVARRIKWRLESERKACWPHGESLCDLRFYRMTWRDWLAHHGAPLMAVGRAFHERLEAEYARHNFPHDPHPHDDEHDRQVGFAAESVHGGQPEKAVIIYNRWARFAGYGELSLRSRSPVLIDIGNALLEFHADSFKVVTCRRAP